MKKCLRPECRAMRRQSLLFSHWIFLPVKSMKNDYLPHIKMLALIVLFWALTGMLMPYVLQMREWGYAGAFAISLVSSASIILPTPGFISIFEMGKYLDPLILGIVAGIGSTIGELAAYYAGKTEQKKLRESKIYKANEKALRKWGPAAMFALAVIPNPALDIAGIAAGAIGMPVWQYLLSVGAAKIIKYTALAYTGLFSIGMFA